MPVTVRDFVPALRHRLAITAVTSVAAMTSIIPASLTAQVAGSTAAHAVDTTVVPAFVDHHVHVFNVGWFLLQARMRAPGYVAAGGAASEAEVVTRVRAAAAQSPAPRFVTGFGWSQDAWGTPVLPSSAALSLVEPNVPVALARTDGHALWVNRAALMRAGLRPASAGVLLERAAEPVLALVPAPSDSDVTAAWRLGAEALAERGVLRVYDAGVLGLPGIGALNTDFGRFASLLAAADRARALPVSIKLMIPAPSRYAEQVLRMTPVQRALSPNVRITHLKLFADGALGSRGAALTHAYADDPHTHGVLRMKAPEIVALTRRALDAGLDVATHAIGDLAVKETLDAYEDVLLTRPRVNPARLRIEHFSYAREADFARAVRLGVALSIQSNFNTPRGIAPTFAEQRVGAAGASRTYAWDRLERMGALLLEGSDYFGEPGAPLVGMYAGLVGANAIGDRGDTPAVRGTLLGLTHRWLAPGGRLDGAGGQDSVVLTGDPLTTPIARLPEIRVLRLIRCRDTVPFSGRARLCAPR